MLDRSTCGQHVFGGCPGADCDRQCSATIWIPPSNTPLGRQMLQMSRTALWMALAAAVTVFIFAASVGLARDERAYQMEQV
jgi:hypothetical protein